MNEGSPCAGGVIPPVTALVVEPKLADVLFVVSALSSSGYRVTVAEFAEARALLSFNPPHLLVADVCQGEFNGLQLVMRGRMARKRMAAMVTCQYEDIVLRRDTEALGGTFVVKPVARDELIAAAARTVWRRAAGADAQPVRPPFERRQSERRASYAPLAAPDRRRADRRRAAGLAV